MTVTVIRADARHLPLEDNSVDLVVTSPPYFALRSYQDGGEHYSGQVGAEATPAEFVAALLEVTRECVRVLKPSGSMWVNLGDKYSGAQAQNVAGANRAGSSARTDPRRTGIPNKSLMGIPWRYALRCIDDLGLILRAEVIWSKPNGLPESVTDRVRRSHETWFHFSLQPRYYSAVDEIREAHQRSWGGAPNGGNSYAARVEPGAKDANLVTALPNPLGKLPGSVWTVPTEPLKVPAHLGVDHFAAFPSEWPRRLVQGWSPSGVCVECGEGRRPVTAADPFTAKSFAADQQANGRSWHGGDPETRALGIAASERNRRITGYACACPEPTAPTTPAVVLDPFGGTGTTAHVASALGRHGISVDLSADYCRLAESPELQDTRRRKVLGIEKARSEVEGQADLFDLAPTPPARPSGGLAYAAARGPRECSACGYRNQYASARTCEKCGAERGAA